VVGPDYLLRSGPGTTALRQRDIHLVFYHALRVESMKFSHMCTSVAEDNLSALTGLLPLAPGSTNFHEYALTDGLAPWRDYQE
jgi:hypothetical protein